MTACNHANTRGTVGKCPAHQDMPCQVPTGNHPERCDCRCCRPELYINNEPVAGAVAAFDADTRAVSDFKRATAPKLLTQAAYDVAHKGIASAIFAAVSPLLGNTSDVWGNTAGQAAENILDEVCRANKITLPEDAPDADIHHQVAADAEAAFWAVVAEAYPEYKTGDVAPEHGFAFAHACDEVVKAWVAANVPKSRNVSVSMRFTVRAAVSDTHETIAEKFDALVEHGSRLCDALDTAGISLVCDPQVTEIDE